MVRTADKTFTQSVSDRLELTRRVLRLTQKDFAERAGMARNHYNMIENNGRPLHVEDAVKICEVHHLTLDWLYRGDPAGLRYEMATAIQGIRRYEELVLQHGKIEVPEGKVDKASGKQRKSG